ncbi:VOC family protein [Rhodobacterales bacterium HKCCE2091]|nr:VOC family protein [Rhodobacterales bacterium HKCCE2091]
MATTPTHPVVWVEIPVTDLEASRAFYAEVLDQDLKIDETGPNPIVMFAAADFATGISGHLYPGTPSRDGSTVHLMAPEPLAAMRGRVETAGGTVEGPILPLPVGAFFYARDPDGNSIGLYRPEPA